MIHHIIIISNVGSGIFPVDGVGRISYGHCLYHSSPFRSITCILFPKSIFLHLILYLLFPLLFRSSSSSTTTHFKFQSLHYHIFIFSPQNMTVSIIFIFFPQNMTVTIILSNGIKITFFSKNYEKLPSGGDFAPRPP